jgi:DeoR family glycerol-3-phosphate regulon repressor
MISRNCSNEGRAIEGRGAEMHQSVRQSEILRLVRQRGSCTIGDLAQRLNVSDETIRRHVKPLATQGLVLRVHGGIVLPDHEQEPPLHHRMLEQKTAKQRIAEAVAEQIRDGESLIIDTGSTTAYVARALVDHANLVVVTNSTQIAAQLATRNNNRVFMTGGELRAHDAAAFGPDATDFVRRFQVQTAVLSMGALHAERGCMDYHLCEAEFSQAAIGQAERVIVAADASKFDRSSLVRVCDFDQIDVLVSDARPGRALGQRFYDAGVTLQLAS